MADSTCGLTVIKRLTYRGNPNEEFSNHYLFSGPTPADDTAWKALFDALVAQEKTLWTASVHTIAGYGYDAPYSKGQHAIWNVDLTQPVDNTVTGSLNAAGGIQMPGDDACWVRWTLPRYNSKGKRVYLRKYYHPVWQKTGFPDTILDAQVAALQAFGTKMMDGSFIGGRKIVSPPDAKDGDYGGLVPIASAASQFITTRTLKRRGKRPPTAP